MKGFIVNHFVEKFQTVTSSSCEQNKLSYCQRWYFHKNL